MTDLQIGLIALGGAAVVGVLVYNKWQEFRHRKVAEQVLRADHDDVLLGRRRAASSGEAANTAAEVPAVAGRREPVLMTSVPDTEEVLPWEEAVAAAPEAAGEAGEVVSGMTGADGPAAEPVGGNGANEVEVVAGEVPLSLLDPRIDFIVVMELVEAVPADQFLYSQREALLRLSKPVIWVGFNERAREWEIIAPDSNRAYRRLRVGLQLADRRGPLSETDFTIFVAAMQQLADELMAVANMAPRHGVLEQAVELDRFCADVDLEIGMHLVSRGTPFSGTKIRGLAEAAGLTLTPDGAFTRFDDEGRAQFRMQNFDQAAFSPETIRNLTTNGLTFLLDVPRVDHGEPVFFKMLDNARRAADALQGQLVDDNRQPLSDAQLDRIRRDFVVKPQLMMQKFGIPAGSPQALRLFA